MTDNVTLLKTTEFTTEPAIFQTVDFKLWLIL
jgi:hypothetical protein